MFFAGAVCEALPRRGTSNCRADEMNRQEELEDAEEVEEEQASMSWKSLNHLSVVSREALDAYLLCLSVVIWLHRRGAQTVHAKKP